jgi:indolepyruvate ferredoxin oxidoreductase beta subunit
MNSQKCYKIYLIGVGGQGTVKTATIIGEAAMAQGFDVVMSEVHGMAQRGGTVVTEVKIGEANSPLIEKNAADLVMAFEPSELLRAISRIGKDTQVIINRTTIIPFTVSLGMSRYPDKVEMFDKLKQKIGHLYLIDAEKLAKEAGHIITTNIVILGAALAVPQFPVKKEFIVESIRKNLPARTVEINIRALELGYQQLTSAHDNSNT